jgi:hypothetical protein
VIVAHHAVRGDDGARECKHDRERGHTSTLAPERAVDC